jgi:hypothetical protein
VNLALDMAETLDAPQHAAAFTGVVPGLLQMSLTLLLVHSFTLHQHQAIHTQDTSSVDPAAAGCNGGSAVDGMDSSSSSSNEAGSGRSSSEPTPNPNGIECDPDWDAKLTEACRHQQRKLQQQLLDITEQQGSRACCCSRPTACCLRHIRQQEAR